MRNKNIVNIGKHLSLAKIRFLIIGIVVGESNRNVETFTVHNPRNRNCFPPKTGRENVLNHQILFRTSNTELIAECKHYFDFSFSSKLIKI